MLRERARRTLALACVLIGTLGKEVGSKTGNKTRHRKIPHAIEI
jgi:hypothetical protein